MPSKGRRGGRARAVVKPKVRAENPLACTESVQSEHLEAAQANVAQAGATQVNGLTAEIVMFEEFRIFQKYMRKQAVIRGATEVMKLQYGAPDVAAQPQYLLSPPPPSLHVHVQGPSY